MRDVIVIGAGGGGAVVAKELAGRGLDVLVLEAGPRHAKPREEWTHFENDANNPSMGFLRWGPADRSKRGWLRDLPQPSAILQCSGVGGTTQHYLGNSPRAMPGAFLGYKGRDAAAYDRAHLFPFSYRSLVPYYEWVEHTLPVQTAAMGRKEQVFLRGAERAGLPLLKTKDITRASYRPQENAILQPRGTAGRTADPRKVVHPRARGCTFCGHCNQGCMSPVGAPRNLFAKRSTDNSYIPMALTAQAWARGGRAATLVADAFATRIGTASEQGELVARSVAWRDGATGETFAEEAKVVVMAGSCVENPRLWLNSGLPDPNGWVGRGLTHHLPDVLFGLFPFYTGHTKGPASAARADFPGHGSLEPAGLPPATSALYSGASYSGLAGLYTGDSEEGPEGADLLGRVVGKELKSYLAEIDRVMGILIISDDDVEPTNRVTLSSLVDEHGSIPRVEFAHRRQAARSIANRRFLVRQGVRILRAAGATKVVRVNTPPTIVHSQSSMRMGLSDSDSVLDASAESRAVRRLFVADNSALANALGGPNPTLTTQALATRTAEKIFQRYFGGSPWVRREAPVASIDRRVTRAVMKLPG